MTEYAEDWLDEDDLLEEFDEEDERVEAINAAIADFEREHGVELSDDEWQHIGTQIDLMA